MTPQQTHSPPPSPLHLPATNRPETPTRAYVFAVLAALAAGAMVAYPKPGIAALAGLIAVFAALRVMQRPFLAVPIVFAIFPIFAILRSAHNAYNLPIFAGGIRVFPEILAALATIGVLLRAARSGGRLPVVTQDDAPALLWILGGVYAFGIALADHVPPFGPLNGWWVSITPAVFYFVARWGRPGADGSRRVVRFFLLTFVLLALGSFGDYLLRPHAIMRLANAERPYFVPGDVPPEVFWHYYPRMQSLLFEENLWGALCTFVLLGCIPHLNGLRTPFRVGALTVLSAFGVLFSISRGAYVCTAVGIMVLLALRGRHRKPVLAALIGILILGIGAELWLGTRIGVLKAVADRAASISVKAAGQGQVASDRTFQWLAGWKIFLQQPSGKGLGTLGYAAHLSGIGQHTIADGIYFRILAEQGAPGFLLSVASLLGMAWVLWRHLPAASPRTRRFGMSMLAFHLGWMVQSVGANTYDFFYIAPLFWTACGLMIDQFQREEIAAAAAASAPPLTLLTEPQVVPPSPAVLAGAAPR